MPPGGERGLRVGVLGPVTVWLDRVRMPPGGARMRALLGLLGCARGEVVSSDALQDGVWRDDAARLDRGTLHVHIHNLRARLGPYGAYVVRVGAGYRLAGDHLTTDLDDLDELASRAALATEAGDHAAAARLLAAALPLWRGDSVCADLPELPVGPVRTHYAHLRQEALTSLFDAELRSGPPADLVPRIEAALLDHPLSERMWALLVAALDVTGRPADALAAARRTRRVLADEAGLDPGPLLRGVEAAVLQQRDPLAALGEQHDRRQPALLWRDGAGRPRSRALPATGAITIGRDPAADVPLEHDALVSRRHAEVAAAGGSGSTGGAWEMRDLGSLNGTRLNGEPLDGARPLRPGDVVQVGGSWLLVHSASGHERPGVPTSTRPAPAPW